MARNRRGSTAALTAQNVRGQLRRRLLGFYDDDRAFRAALLKLSHLASSITLTSDWRTTPPLIWATECSGAPVREAFDLYAAYQSLTIGEREPVWTQTFAPLAIYLEGLADLATRFGLDRLGDEGVDTIHIWCFTRQGTVAIGERWPARSFSQGYQNFGPVVEVGDVVERDLGVLEPDGSRISVKERDVRPIVRIDGQEARWDPTAEPRALAFARLRKQFGKRHEAAIRAELNRMVALAADADARALDTRRNMDRDLQWLFWHLRFHERPAQVAIRTGLPASDEAVAQVRQAVWRIAIQSAIQLHPGWSDWPDGAAGDLQI